MPYSEPPSVDMRELKALEIAARCPLVCRDGIWLVPSQSGQGTYKVCLEPGNTTCSCEDFSLTGQPCKHIHAARIVRQRNGGLAAPAMDTDAIPKRPTYKQNWPVYNLAQTTEKDRFQVLLADLCRGIQEPVRTTNRGRQPVPMADAAFAAVFKVYSGFSSRRFSCDLLDAHEQGFVSRRLHYNSVNAYLEDDSLTPILRLLIVQSSLPLRAVETEFAPDSSGFSVSRYVRWFDEKYGVEKSGKDWVKVHIMAGMKTHIITAVEIRSRDAKATSAAARTWPCAMRPTANCWRTTSAASS